jgi:hypothetical protein
MRCYARINNRRRLPPTHSDGLRFCAIRPSLICQSYSSARPRQHNLSLRISDDEACSSMKWASKLKRVGRRYFYQRAYRTKDQPEWAVRRYRDRSIRPCDPDSIATVRRGARSGTHTRACDDAIKRHCKRELASGGFLLWARYFLEVASLGRSKSQFLEHSQAGVSECFSSGALCAPDAKGGQNALLRSENQPNLLMVQTPRSKCLTQANASV